MALKFNEPSKLITIDRAEYDRLIKLQNAANWILSDASYRAPETVPKIFQEWTVRLCEALGIVKEPCCRDASLFELHEGVMADNERLEKEVARLGELAERYLYLRTHDMTCEYSDYWSGLLNDRVEFSWLDGRIDDAMRGIKYRPQWDDLGD